jgi:hypothetical protein
MTFKYTKEIQPIKEIFGLKTYCYVMRLTYSLLNFDGKMS